MVTISLYRGNLHRVPEIPRRWPSLSPKISLKNFRRLIRRRSSALSILHHHPNPNPNPNTNVKEPKLETPEIKLEPSDLKLDPDEVSTDVRQQEEVVEGTDGADEGLGKLIDGSDLLIEAPGMKSDLVGGDGNSLDEKPAETTNVIAISDTEKRKKEIQEKLEVLNAKKHGYVKVLKQILNAEEELKGQNSTQDMSMRPSIPLHVDVTNDYGSLSRLTTPRLNSDGNLASDIEKGEAGENSPHNTPSGHMARTNTISPSSDSLHRRPTFSAVPHPRGSLGGTDSPSRFAPVGPPTNLSTAVSTSGTGYIASSPSPAASGGTSAFRDNQQPSPWN